MTSDTTGVNTGFCEQCLFPDMCLWSSTKSSRGS